MALRDELYRRFREFLDAESLITDPESQRPFECDGLPLYRELPLLVALPDTIDQVRRILQICDELGVPVVPRGAGTGLSAGATPLRDGVLLGLAKFNRILDIDPLARIARVQPGVTNLAISEAAAEHGLYYAPDPSSQIACTIGGNVAENSGGVHCLKYGLTTHNVLGVELLTVSGEPLSVGGPALDCPGFDLMALLTGSEGLLGVVTEVTVKLLPVPETVRVLVAGFPTVEQAGDCVGRIIGAGIIPAGLEMMDRLAIRAAEDYVHAGYPVGAEAMLLCEVDGTADEVAESAERVELIMREMGADSIEVSRDEAHRLLLWQGRKSAFPAVGRLAPDYYCMDGTIPRHRVSEVLLEIDRMAGEAGLQVANVFHAGDGNLHPLILYDSSRPDEVATAERLGAQILELSVAMGGCITGEHGVGLEKLAKMPAQFSDAELRQFERIKEAFDPGLTLNPGKGIPLLKHCQEYRSLQRGGGGG
jgi:glycolate oxidase